MKKLLFLSLLMLTAVSMQAQTTSQGEEAKVVEMRERIGIDYTVPDYDVKKPDAKVMGWRLTKILQSLEKNYTQGIYNQLLMAVRAEFVEDNRLRYVPIDRMKIQRIIKKGEDITVVIKTMSKSETVGKVDSEFSLVFKKGVSDSDVTNSLFSTLSRYVKENE